MSVAGQSTERRGRRLKRCVTISFGTYAIVLGQYKEHGSQDSNSQARSIWAALRVQLPGYDSMIDIILDDLDRCKVALKMPEFVADVKQFHSLLTNSYRLKNSFSWFTSSYLISTTYICLSNYWNSLDSMNYSSVVKYPIWKCAHMEALAEFLRALKLESSSNWTILLIKMRSMFISQAWNDFEENKDIVDFFCLESKKEDTDLQSCFVGMICGSANGKTFYYKNLSIITRGYHCLCSCNADSDDMDMLDSLIGNIFGKKTVLKMKEPEKK